MICRLALPGQQGERASVPRGEPGPGMGQGTGRSRVPL